MPCRPNAGSKPPTEHGGCSPNAKQDVGKLSNVIAAKIRTGDMFIALRAEGFISAHVVRCPGCECSYRIFYRYPLAGSTARERQTRAVFLAPASQSRIQTTPKSLSMPGNKGITMSATYKISRSRSTQYTVVKNGESLPLLTASGIATTLANDA